MRFWRLPLASNVEKTLHWHDLAKFYNNYTINGRFYTENLHS